MRKNQTNFICGLDIGSSAIRLVVGQEVPHNEVGRDFDLQILATTEAPSAGVHKGVINSIEDVVSSISACLEKAERTVGTPLANAWVGISGLHIISQNSKGVVAVSKADNEISDEDVSRAIEASRAIATPLNYEILHVVPRSFSIDGQTKIKDPVGMTGVRLEVDSQIILGSSSQIKNLTKAIYRAGLTIDDLVLSVLGTAEAVVTARQKEIGVAVVNIGMSTTSLVVYEEGDMLHTAVLPIGSEHITNDIAIGLRTSIDIAESVKIEHGDCTPQDVSRRDEIDLNSLGALEHEMVKKQYVSEIIEARVEEILNKINQELVRIKRNGLLPAGIVFTGGGAKLPGLVDLSKKGLRLPSILGYPLKIIGATEKVNDLSFSTAVGLVKWGSMMEGGMKGQSARARSPGVSFVSGHLKKWFKALIP